MNFKKYHVSRNLFDIEKWLTDRGVSYTIVNGKYEFNTDISLNNNVYYFATDNISVSISGLIEAVTVTSPFITLVNKNGGNAKTTALSPTTIKSENILCAGLKFNWNTGGKVRLSNIMLNTGSTALPYEPYSSEVWHDIPHYIHNTSTDTITTLPADIYANDTTATVGLKGNMEQSSQPSPQTPIQPSECGDLTGNLCNESTIQNGYYGSSGSISTFTSDDRYRALSMAIKAGTYTIKIQADEGIRLLRIATANEFYNVQEDNKAYTFTISADATMYVSWRNLSTTSSFTNMTVMLNTGSTAIPYEPYGIKIPILSNSTTTPVYLGEVQTTRKIKKVVLDGTESIQTVSESTSEAGTYVFGYRYDAIGMEDIIDYNKSMQVIPYPQFICSHFKEKTEGTSWSDIKNGECGANSKTGGNNIFFILASNQYSTGDAFKAYLAAQYAAGTPVCVWYVLATPETAVVNEPLRKIGTYADEVSGITIPVTAGANTLSIGTTLQPSEVTATYKGWHPVQSVHERDNGQWD